MALVKRKLRNKSLVEKCKALKYLENGMSNKVMAAKCDVRRNTVLTWIKSKHKLKVSLEKKEMNSSTKNARCGNYEKVDNTPYNWSIDKRSQEIPIDGVIIKENLLKYWLLQNSKDHMVD